jgi:hypothetical protein
MTYCWA